MAQAPPATAAHPVRMPTRNVRPFMQALADQWPDARTELDYRDPFTLLVAVVLSAQATDAGGQPRDARRCSRIADDPAAMVALGEEGLGDYIKSHRPVAIQGQERDRAVTTLIDNHGGEVPHDREALEALPGVGRKTANVVLNVAFGERTIAVDTHVFRVGNRTGLAPGKTPREVEDGLVKRIPEEYMLHAHHWLILHGRYICMARKPECWRCGAAPWCAYRPKTPEPRAKQPAAKPRGRATAIEVEGG